jgi:NLPA lipoprotein
MRRLPSLLAALLAATLALTACGGSPGGGDSSGSGDSGPSKVIVGASPVPHAKILEFVRDNLAADAGIELEIKEFDDFTTPNTALSEGSIDANYFQHLPYLEAETASKGYKFSHGEGIHIEPYALFSSKHKSLGDIPDGATIAITNDVSNQYRALKLLEKSGLLQNIGEDASVANLTTEQNPRGLAFEENAPEVIVQLREDPAIDLAFINGNFLLTAGLNAEDALLVEEVEGNPYANMLVWRTDNTNTGVATLDGLLHSQQVKDYIKRTWPSGDVIAAG